MVKEPDPSRREETNDLLEVLGSMKVMSSLVDESSSKRDISDVPELNIAGTLMLISSIETMPFVFNASPIVRPLNDSDRLPG